MSYHVLGEQMAKKATRKTAKKAIAKKATKTAGRKIFLLSGNGLPLRAEQVHESQADGLARI